MSSNDSAFFAPMIIGFVLGMIVASWLILPEFKKAVINIRAQAVEYGYADWNTDVKGETHWAFIAPGGVTNVATVK